VSTHDGIALRGGSHFGRITDATGNDGIRVHRAVQDSVRLCGGGRGDRYVAVHPGDARTAAGLLFKHGQAGA
jgi:hypothetical protein